MLALAVGRLVKVKNFDVLLQAWTSVSIPLQIVGDGPEMNRLTRLMVDLSIGDRVEFLGERPDAAELMQRSDLVISTSASEGFSYVVLEALQARTVVISTRTGIAAELVPKAYLIPERNPSQIASTINRAISSFDETKTEFETTWKRAKTLTVDRMVRETQDVYRKTLNLNA